MQGVYTSFILQGKGFSFSWDSFYFWTRDLAKSKFSCISVLNVFAIRNSSLAYIYYTCYWATYGYFSYKYICTHLSSPFLPSLLVLPVPLILHLLSCHMYMPFYVLCKTCEPQMKGNIWYLSFWDWFSLLNMIIFSCVHFSGNHII